METRKQEIDKNIFENLKMKIYNYYNQKSYTTKSLTEELLFRMDKIKSLYVENLVEQGIGKMVHRRDSVSIDEQFVDFKSGMLPQLQKKLEKLISSQIGHELLHGASRTETSGVRKSISIRNNKYDLDDHSESLYEIVDFFNPRKMTFFQDVELDEGITQMMTEKIFDYVVSPQTDSYKNTKKYSKILECTFGEEVMFNSYFFKTGELKDRCNKLSQNDSFYRIFNDISDNYNKASLMTMNGNLDEHGRQIYANFMNEIQPSIMEYFTANIIIPKIRALSEKERKTYIKEILDIAKDGSKFESQIANCIEKMYKMKPEELEKCQQDILKSAKSATHVINSFTKSIYDNDLANSLIDDRGDYLTIKPNRKSATCYVIPNDSLLEEELRSTLTLKADEKEAWSERSKKIAQNGRINFKSDNVSERKNAMSRVKVSARNSGYLILNSLSECETSKSLEIECVHIPKDGSFITYDDLIKINNRYEVETIEDELLGKKDVVIDKKTGKEIDTPEIKKITSYIEVLRNSGINITKNNDTDRWYYESISKIVQQQLNENGSINVRDLYKKGVIPRKIVENSFDTNAKIMAIDSFYRLTNKNATLEQELPETSYEMFYGSKHEDSSHEQRVENLINSITPQDIVTATTKYVSQIPGRLSDGVKRIAGQINKSLHKDDTQHLK